MPSAKEVERKQTSTSALIPEDEVIGSCIQENDLVFDNFLDTEMEVSNLRESKAKRSASSSAQREYAQAMQVIGSSSARRSTVVTAPSKRSRMQPALLPENEVQDDWLEEDLPSPTRKTNKKSNFTFPVHKSSPTTVKDKITTPTSTSSSSRFNRYHKYFFLKLYLNNNLSCNFRSTSKLSLGKQRKSDSPVPGIREINLSDDDDFAMEEEPPLAKRSKPSSNLQVSSDDSNDRASPVLSFSKRPKKPVQLSMFTFTEVI